MKRVFSCCIEEANKKPIFIKSLPVEEIFKPDFERHLCWLEHVFLGQTQEFMHISLFVKPYGGLRQKLGGANQDLD